MARVPKYILIAGILLSSIGCDQATKIIATQQLRDSPGYSFAGDTFRLVYAENAGAFLGMGAGMDHPLRFWAFVVVVGLLVFGGLGYLVVKAPKLDVPQIVAIALLIGGGLSNWIDRLANEGRVVDFMNLGISSLRTGVFNVADLAIVAGAVLIALHRPKPAASP